MSKYKKNSSDPLVGRTILNCTILEKIGEGGFGSVYLAYQNNLNRNVALKLIPKSLSDPEIVKRVKVEAKSIAQLEHNNIVQIYDFGEDENYFIISMQHIDGQSLDDILKTERVLEKDRILKIVRGIAEGLEYAHQKGIIHRDIKPSNIILSQNSIPRIVDFGLAKNFTDPSELTLTGEILGTPHFISPEGADNAPVDQRSDIYSLGATLYRMVYNKPPFTADTPLGVMMRVVREDVDFSDIPEQYSDFLPVLKKMMQKDKDKRYASCAELITDLENIENKIPVKFKTSEKRPTLISILVAILIVTGIASVWWPKDDGYRKPNGNNHKTNESRNSEDKHENAHNDDAMSKANYDISKYDPVFPITTVEENTIRSIVMIEAQIYKTPFYQVYKEKMRNGSLLPFNNYHLRDVRFLEDIEFDLEESSPEMGADRTIEVLTTLAEYYNSIGGYNPALFYAESIFYVSALRPGYVIKIDPAAAKIGYDMKYYRTLIDTYKAKAETLIAETHLAAGDFEEAKKCFQEIIDNSPLSSSVDTARKAVKQLLETMRDVELINKKSFEAHKKGKRFKYIYPRIPAKVLEEISD